MAPGPCKDGRAAAGVEKRGQPFLNLLAVLFDADDIARGGYADNEGASLGIGERADGLSDVGQVESPLELGMPVFSYLDAVQDLQPLHDRPSESVILVTKMSKCVFERVRGLRQALQSFLHIKFDHLGWVTRCGRAW